MEALLHKWASDPVFIVLTAVLGVIGTGASVYGIYLTVRLYRMSQKLPRYTILSTPIFVDLPNKFPDLSIHYAGYGGAVGNLTVTKLLLWNAGTLPILKQDVPAADPIQIVTKGDCKILHAEVVKSQNSASQFEVKYNRRERSRVILSFDFLENNQPVLLKIVHTGTDTADVAITGQIIGAGPPVLIPYDEFSGKSRLQYNRLTTWAVRYAAFLSRMNRRVAFGFLYSLLSLLTVCFSVYKISGFFNANPTEEAWHITFYELAIFAPFAYFYGAVGYFILHSFPPQFAKDFDFES